MYVNNTGYPSVTEIIKPYIDTEWFTEESTERGTAVHEACESYINGLYVIPLINPEWSLYFESFKRWVDTVIDEVILSEKRLIDEKRGYCGKPDAVIRFKGSPLVHLCDWKTSQTYQKWWSLQGIGYDGLCRNNKIYPDVGLSIRLKKDGSGCLLNEYDIRTPYLKNIFTGLLNAHKFFNGGK